MNDKVPDLLVEQLSLGELSAEDASRVREQLARTQDSRLEALDHSNREILADYPAEVMASRIQSRLDALEDKAQRQTSLGWLWIGGLAAMAAGALALWMSGESEAPGEPESEGARVAMLEDPPPHPETGQGPEVLLIKGDPKLVIKRVHGHRISDSLRSGEVQANETLRIAYKGSDAPHGVVLSIDAAGEVTQHFPVGGGTSALNPGVTVLGDFTLDDSPGFERFFFVTCPAPVDVDTVLESARNLAKSTDPRQGELELPKGCFDDRLDEVLFDKKL